MAEQRIRLLIVDDRVIFLRSITGRLHLRGFDVTVASSSREASDVARDGRFDLAVLDLGMPGMDGKQILEILKREQPYIEVIILAHHGSTEPAAEWANRGAFCHLPRPYDLEELLEILGKAYEARLRKKPERDED